MPENARAITHTRLIEDIAQQLVQTANHLGFKVTISVDGEVKVIPYPPNQGDQSV